MLLSSHRRHAEESERSHSHSPTNSHSLAGSVASNVVKYMVTRSLLRRVSRVGGLQGMLISAAATYAIDRFFTRRR